MISAKAVDVNYNLLVGKRGCGLSFPKLLTSGKRKIVDQSF